MNRSRDMEHGRSRGKGVRAFLAVPLSQPARKRIGEVSARLCNHLEAGGAVLKRVRPDSMHMTLKFLGDVERDLVDALCNEVSVGVKDVASFRYVLGGLGFFGSPARPRVLYMGIEQGGNELANLAAVVEAACNRLGFAEEDRAFRPHLTLARFKRAPRKGTADMIGEFDRVEPVVQAVDRVVLYKSTLTPKGAFYDELCSMNLAPVSF